MEPLKTVMVLISGAPGSGKTALAQRLALELRFPLLTKDGFKETLLNTLGAADRKASESLGLASYALLYAVLGSLVGKIPGIIAESNFTRGRSEGELLPIVRAARAVLLHCETTPQEIERRITARAWADDRHAGHYDLEALPGVLDRIANKAFDPLDLPVPLLRIDTTDGHDPPLRDIVRFVRDRAMGL